VLPLLAVLGVTPLAHAAHPMISDDTGTQGTGNLELELGNAWTVQGGVGTFLFQPQLSVGASTSVDLIVQPSYLSAVDASGQRQHGTGDTNVDFKWRFYGAAPFSLALRAGLLAPTSQQGLGIPHGRAGEHVTLISTLEHEPVTVNVDLGYAHVPPQSGVRTDLYHLSSAGMYAINAKTSLVADLSLDSNPSSGGPGLQTVLLGGLIYTVRPGFDIDAGFRGRLSGNGPPQQYLVGLTFRGSP
jgi:hypothetical protein